MDMLSYLMGSNGSGGGGGGSQPTTEITIDASGAVDQEIQCGKVYHFTSNNITSLTISFAPIVGFEHYHFDFISPSTPLTLILPASVKMPDGFNVDANKRYEIDILNGYGVAQEWSVS